jgi:hypothetical protein
MPRFFLPVLATFLIRAKNWVLSLALDDTS